MAHLPVLDHVVYFGGNCTLVWANKVTFYMLLPVLAAYTHFILMQFCFFSTSKCSLSTSRCWCKNVQDDSKPIRYTTSAAKQWQSIKTFEIPEHMKKMPPYQPYSVILSVLAILLYFGVLREENDMDELLGLSLYERMPGLEEKNIRIAIDYEKSLGRSTTELERRLVDLEQTGSG